MEKAPVRRSLLRRITWFGGDRRLVGFTGLLAFCLAWTMVIGFGFLFGLSLILPAVFAMAVVFIARLMNDSDPWMVDVVLRQYKYKKYYTPKSDLGIEHPMVRDFT